MTRSAHRRATRRAERVAQLVLTAFAGPVATSVARYGGFTADGARQFVVSLVRADEVREVHWSLVAELLNKSVVARTAR
jgi:hypothetical protein